MNLKWSLPPRRIVLATRNAHKIREIRRICAGAPIEWVGLDAFPDVPAVEESGGTFEANARLKAEAVARATGEWAAADDSGIEVDALGGAPGVRSARYAGGEADDAANNAKLLRELAGVPPERRTARYRCVCALASPDGVRFTVEGVWEGVVALAPRGAGGFGYDPLFLLPADGRTAAELAPDEKDAVSHRGKAFRALAKALGA